MLWDNKIFIRNSWLFCRSLQCYERCGGTETTKVKNGKVKITKELFNSYFGISIYYAVTQEKKKSKPPEYTNNA